MRTSRRVTVPVNRERFAIISTNDSTRIVLQDLDLELYIRKENADTAKILWQLLNALTISVTAERVDWDARWQAPQDLPAPEAKSK